MERQAGDVDCREGWRCAVNTAVVLVGSSKNIDYIYKIMFFFLLRTIYHLYQPQRLYNSEQYLLDDSRFYRIAILQSEINTFLLQNHTSHSFIACQRKNLESRHIVFIERFKISTRTKQ